MTKECRNTKAEEPDACAFFVIRALSFAFALRAKALPRIDSNYE